jgi:hypothetical protein
VMVVHGGTVATLDPLLRRTSAIRIVLASDRRRGSLKRPG